MHSKLISALIPAYNAERYLSEAIESVLAQTCRPVEIIVVDDGSRDSTGAIARSYPDVRYVYQSNQTPAAARNTGLANSTGELIAFLDADDYWPPHYLMEQVERLAGQPELGCVVGRWQNFLEKGIEMPHWVAESMLGEDAVSLGLQASLIHRWVFDRVGGFNIHFPVASDMEWFFRVREAGIPIGFTSSIVMYRRIHDANISRHQCAVIQATIRCLKEHMDRKRGKSPMALPGVRV